MRRKLQHGFTMVEMMVVLVILSILAAIAIPNLTAYIHLSQFRKNESFAKSMYLSAESSLTYRRTGGQWDVLKDQIKDVGTLNDRITETATDTINDRIYALRLDAGEYSGGHLSGDGQLVAELLESDTYDQSILNEAICIEVDVDSGQVYSVFYGTNCDGLRYESEAQPGSGVWLDLNQRDYDTRRAERLGYYSTQDVSNVVDLELTKLKITSISLVNSETLNLNWATNSKHNDRDVKFTIKLYEKGSKNELLSLDLARPDGGDQVEATVSGVGTTSQKTFTFPLTYTQEGRFVLTLDAMMTAQQMAGLEANQDNPAVAQSSSTSITRFGANFAAAKDIYATVQAFPASNGVGGGEYTASSAAESNDANTLYADGADGDTASITTFRHLSNVRYGQDGTAFTISARSLDWNSDNIVLYRTEDQANTKAVLTPVKSSAVGFPTIPTLKQGQSLNGSGGLLDRISSIFTGGNSISNLTLNASSVGSSAQYLGLIGENYGSITGMQLTNAVVSVDTSDTLLGVGALCGRSEGKLSSSACSTDMNVTLTNPGAQGIGGVAGWVKLSGTKTADTLAASGEITGSLPVNSAGNGIGGITGAVKAINAQGSLKNAENTANVTGNLRVGGVAGYAEGKAGDATDAPTLEACSNEGLILSSKPASGSGDEGCYIGGIVGYGTKATLDSCTSRAGYGSYTYEDGKQDQLQGKYVGGILGFGLNSMVRDSSTQAGGYVLGHDYVGGIVGGMSGRAAQNALVTVKLAVTTNASYVIGYNYVGGIVGVNEGNITVDDCVNTGVAAGYGQYIGGICGANRRVNGQIPTIKNCASYVSDTHNTIYNMVVGWHAVGDYAGGLVGYNDGSIIFNNDNNKVSTKSVAGIVVGRDYVGGLVGFNAAGGTINVDYTLIGGRVAATGDCVGGLIGLNASEDLLGKTLTIQPGSVQGRYYVGGAIGANVVNLTQETTMQNLTVNNSLGILSGEAFCGGLIGYQRTYASNQADGTAASLRALLPGVNTSGGNVPTQVTPSTNPNRLIIQGAGNDDDHLKKASNNMTIRAYAYAGGIVGYCEGSSQLLLKNCLNAGGFDQPAAGTFPNSTLRSGVDMVRYLNSQGYTNAATALQAELGTGNALRVSIVGGVMGVNGVDHVIDHCGNTGVMNGQTAMGGVVGLNEGLVTDCALSGSMGSATQDYVGGIAGLNVGGKNTESKTYDTQTYQAGTITACATRANNTVTGRNTVGGIVGYNMRGGTVQDNTGGANVTGTDRVGGIAGENGGTVSLAGTTATNTRAVTGSGQGVGGILGVNTATGTLTTGTTLTGGDAIVTDHNLTVQGQTKVGGIAGINRGALGGSDASYLTNQAGQVRATLGMAGGVVGAQEGTGTQGSTLSYAKNQGQVIANKGAAGGIVGKNDAGHTVSHCTNTGSVTSNDGYAGGVVSENLGTVSACMVDGTNKVTITARGVDSLGAVCAVNRSQGVVTGSNITGDKISLEGQAAILGALVGDNYGTVSNSILTGHPNYNVSASELTVGGAVGRNSAGGNVTGITAEITFDKFSTYRYLGGIVGENCAAVTNDSGITTLNAAQVKASSYTGTIAESKSAVGNCYGGIAGLNRGTLTQNNVSALTITATGVYTATSTSTAAQKEELSSHIGGIAGKNETTGTIDQCYISDQGTSTITVQNGMVGGVTGYNKGTITHSGDASTKALMEGVTKVSDLLSNAKDEGLAADATWVGWKDKTTIEALSYNNGTALTKGRTMQIIVSSNGNLGGLAGYNAPTGEMSYCASGNWLLINKSESIGVGTGGMIGMNETEKDLTFLLNRAFVGRQISSPQTNRFAGGIIGNQNNSTTSSWIVKGCVNYGTIYAYNSHYSGGIIGQWTNNGGTVEGCYNYGNLQTTIAIGWYGASGGIVAQLYHGASDQSYNIISSQNHGSMYSRWGESIYDCANDSGGILGNITSYQAEKGQGQRYTINVVDCVNGPGVKIYSASMSSGIVCFFSADGVANITDNNKANATITNSTENIVLNIDRCRNYAQTLTALRFTGGILGDRYAYDRSKPATDTYIQNCFSMVNGSQDRAVIFMGNWTSDTMNRDKVGNNYYFDDAWGITNQDASGAIQEADNRQESRRGYSRMLAYGLFDQRLFAAVAGPTLTELNTSVTADYKMYYNMTKANTTIDSHGIMTETSTGKIVGRVIYDMPYSYEPYIFNHGGDTLQNAIKYKDGKASGMDTYVHEGYREMEHDQTGKKLNDSFSLALSQNDTGSFDVTIQDDDRPLYYEGEVYVEGQTEPVLKNLRFLPNQKGQGQWDPKLDGTQSYGEGVTTGSFTLTKELLKEHAGETVTLRVRAVSQFEDTQPSEWLEQSTSNTSFLPKPDVRIQLVRVPKSGYSYQYALTNADDYASYNNWQVTVQVANVWTGGKTLTLTKDNLSGYIQSKGVQEMTLTATAGETNGHTPDPVTVRQSIYTPSTQNNWQDNRNSCPDATLNTLTAEISGNTMDDLVISAKLTANETSADIAPIYRVELLGKVNGKDIVFTYEDVLLSVGGEVEANFRDLPKQIFDSNVSNLRLRAWYCASGLGPVYTYGEDTEKGNYTNGKVTMRTFDAQGNATDTYTYSTVLRELEDDWAAFRGQNGHGHCIKETGTLDLKSLPAPVLSETAVESTENGSLYYTFSWDQGTNAQSGARYTVRLMGVMNDRSQVGISTADVYTDDTQTSFKINADDWKYSQVILTVTRVGSGNSVGLSASKTYAVSQRLERPGQPVVSNPDTNELFYDISWAALADETGCGGYQLIAALGNSTAQLAYVPASGQSSYSVQVDLEKYAGEQITLYLIAKGGQSGYADSPNGVSYTMTVPTRVGTPNVEWSTNFQYNANGSVTVAHFQGGGLTVSVTPTDAASYPPGGSTYLLRAAVYADAACTQKLADYPGAGQVSAMADSGGKHVYTLELNGLSADYAGKWIRFQTRISSAAGQVSSAWVTSGAYQLPRVKLDTPVTAMDYQGTDTTVEITTTPGLPGKQETWSARRTLVTWPQVDHAGGMRLTLTSADGTTMTLRLTTENGLIVEKQTENSWQLLTAGDDGYYHLTTDQRGGRYTPAGGTEMAYSFSLDTLLKQESDGTFTLCLPNLSTLTTSDGQTLTYGLTLMTRVAVQADTAAGLNGGSDAAYAASEERELAFGG